MDKRKTFKDASLVSGLGTWVPSCAVFKVGMTGFGSGHQEFSSGLVELEKPKTPK